MRRTEPYGLIPRCDHLIHYTDFTQGGSEINLILDIVDFVRWRGGGRARPHGNLNANSGVGGQGSGAWLHRQGAPLSPFVRHRLRPFLSLPRHEDLVALTELIEAGEVTAVIDRTYALGETPEAVGYVGGGHARGKVVVTA